MNNRLRTLVVDDSVAYRLFLRKAVEELNSCEYVGAAKDGVDALEQIEKLQPDLVTLDIAMPNKGGLDVLRELQDRDENPTIILVSSLAEAGNSITTEALGLGALDFVTKPVADDLVQAHTQVAQNLSKVVERVCEKLDFEYSSQQPKHISCVDEVPPSREVANLSSNGDAVDAIVIGISTGGPEALTELFSGLPDDLDVPILIVQHMPPVFTKSLANSLNALAKMTVKEAEHGEPLKQNVAYIAPGGKQMRIVSDKSVVRIEVTDDEPELFCRPSANYLFESVSNVYKGNVLAIVMTGLGTDGTRGVELLRRKGAAVFSQDKESCAVWGMPGSAVKAGLVDQEIPLAKIAEQTTKFIRGRNKNEPITLRV